MSARRREQRRRLGSWPDDHLGPIKSFEDEENASELGRRELHARGRHCTIDQRRN